MPLLGALLIIGCGAREPSTESGQRAFEFSEVELRCDDPALRLVSVSGAVHESVCDWAVSLRNGGSEPYAATVAVTVAYHSRGKQRFLRLTTSLDLGPGEGLRLRTISRPGLVVDGVDWVDLRRIGEADRTDGTPPPLA